MSQYPDLPNCLRISQSDRKEAWRGRRMTRAGASFKPEKKVEDPVTRQLRRALEAQEKTKRDARFARLKELKDANRKQRSRT